MMPVGSKWEICIPQELAYGARQAGQIKPYSTLIFTVELVSIEKAKEEAKKVEPGNILMINGKNINQRIMNYLK